MSEDIQLRYTTRACATKNSMLLVTFATSVLTITFGLTVTFDTHLDSPGRRSLFVRRSFKFDTALFGYPIEQNMHLFPLLVSW